MSSNAVIRQILRAKQYYLTIVLSLTFTLAMVFAVFSIFDAIYLKPLPYKNAEDIYQLDGMVKYQGTNDPWVSPPGLVHIKNNSSLIENMAIYFFSGYQQISSFQSRPEIPIFYTSPDFFYILQVAPVIGRFFNETENIGNKQTSAVLSYQVWQEQFEGDENIIGKSVQLNHKNYTIIGVTPDNWVLPDVKGASEAIWLPRDTGGRSAEKFIGFTDSFKALIRLKTGVTPQELLKEIEPLYIKGIELVNRPELLKLFTVSTRITSFPTAVRGDSAVITVLLVGGVSLLIFIALVNLSNLQMARAAGRIKPLSIGFAFGATRKQIFKELFIHNFSVVSVAVLLGLAVTALSFNLLKNMASETLPRMDSIGITNWMVLFAALLTMLISTLFSCIELSVANEKQLRSNLQSSGKGIGKQMSKEVSHALIGLQFCFSVLILVSSTLILHSTLTEALRPNNVNTEHLWYIKLGLSEIDRKEERINVNRGVMQHLKSRDDIEVVSYSSEMRIDDLNSNFVFNEKNEQIASARRVRVDVNHLNLFGINVDGRNFTLDDYGIVYHPIIISQRLADLLPDGGIGQKLILDDQKAHEIIGIAENTNFPGFTTLEVPEVYLPFEYSGWRSSVLLVKVSPKFDSFHRSKIIAELLKIDPRLDLKELVSVDNQFSELSKNHRFAAYISGTLALVSLAMVIAGIAGMVSYMLNMRRYDMGVKMAMGASNKTLLRAQLVKLSMPLGMALLFAFSLIYFALGYSRTVPDWIFAVQWKLIFYVMLSLSFIVAIACFIPTWKILKTDPIKALRNE